MWWDYNEILCIYTYIILISDVMRYIICLYLNDIIKSSHEFEFTVNCTLNYRLLNFRNKLYHQIYIVLQYCSWLKYWHEYINNITFIIGILVCYSSSYSSYSSFNFYIYVHLSNFNHFKLASIIFYWCYSKYKIYSVMHELIINLINHKGRFFRLWWDNVIILFCEPFLI